MYVEHYTRKTDHHLCIKLHWTGLWERTQAMLDEFIDELHKEVGTKVTIEIE